MSDPSPCAACGAAKRAHGAWVSEPCGRSRARRYLSTVRFAGALGGDEHEPVAGRERDVCLTVTFERHVEAARLSIAGLDVADASVDVVHPEPVRVLRVELEDEPAA